MTRASGTFEVAPTPQPALDAGDAAEIGHTIFRKTFTGDLVATSVAQMLSVIGAVKGSAGYVAMERVSGTLHGKSGSFFTQHMGVMDRSTPSLVITVVPDTGTGELQGLSGRFIIEIKDKQHFYHFDYELGAPAP
jgi:hypothetical protein